MAGSTNQHNITTLSQYYEQELANLGFERETASHHDSGDEDIADWIDEEAGIDEEADIDDEEDFSNLPQDLVTLLARPVVQQPEGAIRGAIGFLLQQVSKAQQDWKDSKRDYIRDETWDLLYRYEPAADQVTDKFNTLREEIEDLFSVYFPGHRKSVRVVTVKRRCWERLQEVIFGVESEYWGGEIGATLWEWFDDLIDEVRARAPPLLLHIHEQRARIATLLERIEGRSSAEKDAQAVNSIFGPYLQDIDPAMEVEPDGWENFLRRGLGIVHIAADLDSMFRRSVTDYGLLPSEAERESRMWKNARASICHYGLCIYGEPLGNRYDMTREELVAWEDVDDDESEAEA